jgi:uncharacterized protein YndB with AHSA1/START domain
VATPHPFPDLTPKRDLTQVGVVAITNSFFRAVVTASLQGSPAVTSTPRSFAIKIRVKEWAVTDKSGISIEGTLHSANGVGVVRLDARFESDCDDLWSALTDPERLAFWYGRVEGDLHDGGEFAAYVWASEWDGRGKVDACVPGRRLEVTMWEEEGTKHEVAAELIADGVRTTLKIEVRGVPVDFVWAYGAGWQVHLEDLGSHLSGMEGRNLPSRWDELEPLYHAMTVEPL